MLPLTKFDFAGIAAAIKTFEAKEKASKKGSK